MKVDSFFPKHIKAALKNEPPGAWMPNLPAKCIRLSSGYPDPALVPSEDIKAAVARLIEEERDLPLHYIGSPRIGRLKLQILQRMVERGMNVQEDQVLITAGACQAIDLISQVLLDDKAAVAVEAPTYMEALEIFQNYTKDIFSIPIDEYGLQTEILAAVLAERKRLGQTIPRFLYTIPTFQNPTGTTMSLERRIQLLELSETYDFLIVEDDAYGELAFRDSPVTLKAIDDDGRVLYVGSLSKMVAPGMRIGWIAGERSFIDAFAWFKKDLDHPFAQATMASYLEKVNFAERLDTLKAVYRKKSVVLTQALKKYMPESVDWFVPEGGYFVWVKIPGIDTTQLLNRSLIEGVSYIPGKYFFLIQEDGKEFLRLSFSYADEADIEEGVQILGELVQHYI